MSTWRASTGGLLVALVVTVPAGAQGTAEITGDRLTGFVLPVEPADTGITITALRAWAWSVDDTRRLLVEGDVRVQVGGYDIDGDAAVVWINRIPSADGLINQLAVYFTHVRNPAGRSGLGVSGTGVLRLLEAGHFKGVAELQQRIRFHEELSSKTDADAAATFEAGAEDLLIDIRGEIKTIVRSLALDETPLDAAASDGGSTEPLASSSLVLTFEASVEEAIADATVDGTLDIESATADIQAAFDTMTASLTALYESTLTVDGDTVTATDSTLLDDAIASLALVYEEAMAALLASVEESSELEDPTPAPGNGVAFDKFLAIYDSLRYGDSSTIDQTA